MWRRYVALLFGRWQSWNANRRLDVSKILVVLIAGVIEYPCLLPYQIARDRKYFGKENRVVEGCRPLNGIGTCFPESFGEMQFPAVLVARRVEPCAIVDADGVHHESVAFPLPDRMPH